MAASEQTPKGRKRALGRPRDWDDKTQQNIVKSLERALEVLEYLSTDQGKTLSQLASELAQSPATLYRVLVTLQTRGLVEFDADEQRWYIGAQAFVIGSKFLRRTSLVERARPILRRLMEQTGETANLGVEKGGMVLFVSQVETHAAIRAFFPPGTLSAMHASGIGKALMAQMDPRRLTALLEDRGLEVFTPHTLVTPQAVHAAMQAIRDQGFAVDNEEKNLGMRCIAAPVFDSTGEAVAGLSVSGPTARVRAEDVERLSLHVREAARHLTTAIGGSIAAPVG